MNLQRASKIVADDAFLGCPETASSAVPKLKDIKRSRRRAAAELYIDNGAGKFNIEVFS